MLNALPYVVCVASVLSVGCDAMPTPHTPSESTATHMTLRHYPFDALLDYLNKEGVSGEHVVATHPSGDGEALAVAVTGSESELTIATITPGGVETHPYPSNGFWFDGTDVHEWSTWSDVLRHSQYSFVQGGSRRRYRAEDVWAGRIREAFVRRGRLHIIRRTGSESHDEMTMYAYKSDGWTPVQVCDLPAYPVVAAAPDSSQIIVRSKTDVPVPPSFFIIDLDDPEMRRYWIRTGPLVLWFYSDEDWLGRLIGVRGHTYTGSP